MGSEEGIGRIIFGISVRTLVNVLFIFGLVEGFVYFYHFSYKLFGDIPYKPAVSQTVTVTIEPGAGSGEIARLLDSLELVDSEYLLLARMYLGKYNSRIQAGTYSLTPSMSPDEICRRICGMQSEETS